MEITLNTSNAYEIIKKIADEFQGRLHIVLNRSDI